MVKEKKEQKAFILFGEGLETNVEELNEFLSEGWVVTHTCPMPSSVSTSIEGTRFYEPQCVIILEKISRI